MPGFERYEDFLNRYVLAKEDQADGLAEEILEIADNGKNDWMERFDKDGKSLGSLPPIKRTKR